MKWLVALIGLIFSAWYADAQVRLYADSTRMLIGDQVELYLEYPTGRGQVVNPVEELPDSLKAIRVLNSYPPDESRPGYLRHHWRIGVYDTGVVVIPSLPVILNDGGRLDTMWSNDLPFFVSGVKDSLPVLSPIKPIIAEPLKFEDFIPWIGLIFGLIIVGLILYFYFRKRKPQEEPVEEHIVRKPADEVAMEKLDELEKEKLWQQGEVSLYHSKLNYIFREYLEYRFRIPALESATSEVIAMLPNLYLDKEIEAELRKMLNAVDLIKFAKAEPPAEIHAEYLELARKLVIRTRGRLQAGAEENSDKEGEGDV